MRFIVDLYKLIIYIVLALIIIGVVLVIAELMKAGGTNPAFMGIYLYGIVSVLVTVVLFLGILATFISIHDRHAEIVDELREIADAIRGEGTKQ
ncbi:MAG: hypothetical protein E7773_05035 [Sphingomonas sp.]|uniref:hypothetical protein n=1 Tax=Sphingomonas sp. TaxID=28214 RepID=UPI0011FBF182|nr:hypothetical protein [Sphingomonas sp.]THD37388.1 MAG: hypothetical protein E7773_05035 [Sphingomonas sp.]